MNENKDSSQERRTLEQSQFQDISDFLEVGKKLNTAQDFREIIDQILLSLMGRLMIHKSVFLLVSGEDDFQVTNTKGLHPDLLNEMVTDVEIPEKPCLVASIDYDVNLKTFLDLHDMHILFPVISRNALLGAVAFGEKLSREEFDRDEINYVSSLISISTTLVENSLFMEELNGVNKGLDRKNQELQTLFELGRELNSTLDPATIVRQFGFALMGQLMVNKFLLFIKKDGGMVNLQCKGFSDRVIAPLSEYSAEMISLKNPERVGARQSTLHKTLKDFGFSAVIPMRVQDETKGLLCIGPRSANVPYADDDLQFLLTMCGQAIISLENARLFEEVVEKQRLEEELALAREIQQGLLTDDFPVLDRWGIHARNIPSKEVGGDYFDVVRMDDGRFALAIADVSGKGTPAALLMSNLQASLRALVNVEPDLGKMVTTINNLIFRNTSPEKFITFFIGLFNPDDGVLNYCNAGHNPPLHFNDKGDFKELREGGLLLGIMRDVPYETASVGLRKGDKIVLYTDGISEAPDSNGQEFGETRLRNAVDKCLKESSEVVIENVLSAVELYADNPSANDDMTLLVLSAF